MKLRMYYELYSETTLKPKVIIQNIKAKLDDKNYAIVSVTDSSVEFRPHPRQLRRSVSPSKLDGGVYTISPSNIGATISLRYYLNILPYIFMITAMAAFLTTFQNIHAGLVFFTGNFFLAGVIYILALKNRAKVLLIGVLDGYNQN